MNVDLEALKTVGYVIGAAAGGMGAGIAAVKTWPIWRKNSNDKKKCSDPDCHDLVIITAEKVETLEDGQAEIFKKLNDINTNMPSRIVTLLKDTKGLLQ